MYNQHYDGREVTYTQHILKVCKPPTQHVLPQTQHMFEGVFSCAW